LKIIKSDLINDNPLIKIISKKAIELRLNKLVKFGLLQKFTDKKQGNKTFYALLNNFDK